MKAPTGTQSVDRAARLVSAIVCADEPRSFTDLAAACGMPRSTTSRLLTTLERTGLVSRTDSGAYVPGALFSRHADRHRRPNGDPAAPFRAG